MQVTTKNPYTTLSDIRNTSLTKQQNYDFVPVHSPCDYTIGTTSMDPRLMNSPRGMRLILDSPPFRTKNIDPIQNLYSSQNNIHTGFYSDYSQILGGDFIYYTDYDIAEPYGKIPYTLESKTIPKMLVDPMGSYRPIYEKIPVFQNNRTDFPYTFDQDQVSFREDLMSLQSRKINESSFDTFQLFNNPEKYFSGNQ